MIRAAAVCHERRELLNETDNLRRHLEFSGFAQEFTNSVLKKPIVRSLPTNEKRLSFLCFSTVFREFLKVQTNRKASKQCESFNTKLKLSWQKVDQIEVLNRCQIALNSTSVAVTEAAVVNRSHGSASWAHSSRVSYENQNMLMKNVVE
jgi:hypothetical protein